MIRNDTTFLLARLSNGDAKAKEELIAHVYDELRRLASRCLTGERPGHSLQATALVHEAYLRLVGATQLTLKDRSHFFAVAAQTMRRILVDHARHQRTVKRGGGIQTVELDEALVVAADKTGLVVALDEALNKLESVDGRLCRVVELHYFAGLSMEEVATSLGVSSRTVKRDWMMARTWLRGELNG